MALGALPNCEIVLKVLWCGHKQGLIVYCAGLKFLVPSIDGMHMSSQTDMIFVSLGLPVDTID